MTRRKRERLRVAIAEIAHFAALADHAPTSSLAEKHAGHARELADHHGVIFADIPSRVFRLARTIEALALESEGAESNAETAEELGQRAHLARINAARRETGNLSRTLQALLGEEIARAYPNKLAGYVPAYKSSAQELELLIARCICTRELGASWRPGLTR